MLPPVREERQAGEKTPEKKRRPSEEGRDAPCQEEKHRIGKLPRYYSDIPPPSPVLVPSLVQRIVDEFRLDDGNDSLEVEDVFKLWKDASVEEDQELVNLV